MQPAAPQAAQEAAQEGSSQEPGHETDTVTAAGPAMQAADAQSMPESGADRADADAGQAGSDESAAALHERHALPQPAHQRSVREPAQDSIEPTPTSSGPEPAASIKQGPAERAADAQEAAGAPANAATPTAASPEPAESQAAADTADDGAAAPSVDARSTDDARTANQLPESELPEAAQSPQGLPDLALPDSPLARQLEQSPQSAEGSPRQARERSSSVFTNLTINEVFSPESTMKQGPPCALRRYEHASADTCTCTPLSISRSEMNDCSGRAIKSAARNLGCFARDILTQMSSGALIYPCAPGIQ